ncbi:MAG: peptidase dimerization domain-containing protein [Acidobacteria bacterium]|nr:peptidase dimerization domain-containing protein [Acidobacteriota bacterium]
MTLNSRISELTKKYRPLAIEILKEAIRVPADYVDKAEEQGGDPHCGLSNHEGPRVEYLRAKIVEIGAVERAEDAGFDAFGNLVWVVQDRNDGVPASDKTVVYYDGHTDTVKPLRNRWHEATGGLDPFNGLVDASKLNREFLRSELGFLPPDDEWHHLVWGRGAADQLSGVVSQVIATKILLETRDLGSLRGVIVRSYGTVTEEDNDGGSMMHVRRHEWPNGGADVIPDAIILTEGTGCAKLGAVGIYRGQRGRMQIEVEVTGKSCHGSMPWEGRNPLEFGASIIVEAAERYRDGVDFGKDEFLGGGTRTASWATLQSPSDCAVPERFTFRFDRRLTAGEDPQKALLHVDGMDSVKKAREAGLQVVVRAPYYDEPSWRGTKADNPQIYPGWVTPEDHPAIVAAVDAYTSCATPIVEVTSGTGAMKKEPRVARWIFSTDGVGFPIPVGDDSLKVGEKKRWVNDGTFKYPPMLGIGPGLEQNTHKIGECIDSREFDPVIATLARFPSRLRELKGS